MSYNKKALLSIVKKLDKAKAPGKPKDIITDPMGQWKYPGQNTRIPGSDITMQGVNYPVFAQPNVGQPQMMYPGQEYQFPGADYVDEFPQMQEGGVSPLEGNLISKVIMNRNRGVDFVDRAYALGANPGTPMFNVPDNEEFGSWMSHKMATGEDDNGQAWMFPTVMNPNDEAIAVPNQYADYISSTGYKNATGMIPEEDYIEADLSEDEINEYRKGGYIVEDISVPQLTQAQKGKEVKKSPYQLQEEYRKRYGQPKYDMLESNKPQVSETTKLKNAPVVNKTTNSAKPNFIKSEVPNYEKEALINNLEKENQIVKDYYSEYEKSPRYIEMLQKSSPNNYNYFSEGRHFNLKDPSVNFLPDQPSDSPTTGGYSMSSTGDITVLPKGLGVKGLLPHEWSHSLDRPLSEKGNRLIPKNDINYINKNKPSDWFQSPEFSNYNPELKKLYLTNKNNEKFSNTLKEKKEFMEYVGTPTETRARLNDIRYQSKKRDIYNPFTERVTPETYKELLDTEFEKGNNKGFDALRQLKKVYTDKEIQYMLNNVSDNQNEQKENNNLPQAQVGKQVKKSPYQLQEEARKKAGQSKYDMLESNKPQVSENTKPKNAPVVDKNITAKALNQKNLERQAIAEEVKNQPLLSEEQKTEILLDPRKLDENAYLINQQDPGTVQTKVEQTWQNRLKDIALNPDAAIYYGMSGKDMPSNYQAMMDAGIDPMANEAGGNSVLKALNSLNPLVAMRDINTAAGEGNYTEAGLGLLGFLPGGKQLKKIGQVINTTDAVSDVNKAINFTGPLKHKYLDTPKTLNALRERGSYWDKTGAKGEELLHKDMINYHGTYAGRPIVEVKMPDGSSEMFYKSSGWAGKKGTSDKGTTEGMWQVFGGHSDTPETTNWFIKDKDYQNYYGSNTFGNMAENMDNALMQKHGFNSVDELDNAYNFQNRFGNTDSFTPNKKNGGFIEADLSNEEIEEYRKGGYIIEEIPNYNFQVGGQKEGEVLDIPEMQAYADPNKRKQQHKLIDKARAIASTIEGRQALKQGNYKDFSIENMKKFIKSATDYKKEAEDYHKARRLVSENKMDSDSFARRYNEKGWAKFDEDVANENYKGEYQQAVDKANKRKEKNMAYTDAVLAFTGAPALQRIAEDPIGTAKGVGQTIGDLATLPYGVAEGAYNYITDGNFDMGTNAFGQKYGEGVNETLDVLAVAPAFAGVSKITDLATPALIKGVNKLGKYATTQTPLAKAYKLNPYAEKLNDVNKSYRVAGLDALEDFQNSGVLRSATPTITEEANLFQRAEHRPTAFPSFQKGYADISYAKPEGSVVFETKLPTFKRGDINPVTGGKIKGRHYAHRVIDPKTGRTMTEIPGSEIRIFGDKPHWLKGYPEVPKELPSSPNNSELVDLWRIQEKGARPMAELATEGKLGKHFQNEKAIQHFKDREEHFGQWFTKDKSDFDFYKADREFIDPEVIKLQVPKSKLESFTDYNKSLSRAPDREFVVPSEKQNLYKVTDTPNELPSSPNVYPTESLAMPTATAPLQTIKPAWKLENLPGLQLKSTMFEGPISKIVEPKTGLINVEQALGIIGKESSGADKVALIKQGLGETIPKKMDFNEFRKLTQEQLIPLEKTLVDHSSDYGLERIGYTSDNLVTKEVDGKIIHEFAPDYIENQTLILSNKDKFGRGSKSHGNPDETLGHIHFFRNAENPDVLTVSQIQSDAFQGTYRNMPKSQDEALDIINKLKKEEGDDVYTLFGDESESSKKVRDYYENKVQSVENEFKNFKQKQLLDKNHQERYIQELVDYASKRGDVNKVRLPTSDTAAKIQGYDTQKTWNITNLENGDDVVLNDGTVGKVTSDTFINSITVTTQDGKKLSIDMSDAGYGSSKNSPVESVNNVNVKEVSMFSPEHTTILKKYSEQPKLIKKLYGVDVKIVKDSKGNSWYEFNIPDKFKEGTGEIKAFKYGGNVNKLKKFIN